MESINASEVKTNLFRLVEQVNQSHLPLMITSHKGDAVLLSMNDWKALQETLHLQSLPGLIETIRSVEQDNEWVSEADFLRELNGVDN